MPPALPRFPAALIAGLAFAGRLPAQDPAGNALMLFDSYLAQAALSNPAYRTDLKAGGGPAEIQPGRLSGDSPMIGPFTYRPKTFGELNRAERAALLHDPGFRAFLIATREQADRTDAPGVPDRAAARPLAQAFSVAPDEMLRPRPIFVVLAQP